MRDADAAALQLVMNCIEALGDDSPDALTAEKVRTRGVVVDDPRRPGWIVVEVERHRAVLSYHEPRTPMESFVTIWPRYAYHPKSGEFERLPPVRQAKVTVDHQAYVREYVRFLFFRFEPLGEGRHRCWLLDSMLEQLGHLVNRQMPSRRCEVTSLADVESFARLMVRTDRRFEPECYQLLEYLPPEDVTRIFGELAGACERALCDRARNDWRSYLDSSPSASGTSPTSLGSDRPC